MDSPYKLSVEQKTIPHGLVCYQLNTLSKGTCRFPRPISPSGGQLQELSCFYLDLQRIQNLKVIHAIHLHVIWVDYYTIILQVQKCLLWLLICWCNAKWSNVWSINIALWYLTQLSHSPLVGSSYRLSHNVEKRTLELPLRVGLQLLDTKQHELLPCPYPYHCFGHRVTHHFSSFCKYFQIEMSIYHFTHAENSSTLKLK